MADVRAERLGGGVLLTPSNSSSSELKPSVSLVAPVGDANGASSSEPAHNNHDLATDDTSSAMSTDFSGPYHVIEYDVDGDLVTGESLSELQTLTIEENSPAAEAIRANANIRVSTMGKAARAVHMQAVRRFVKRATGATKSGLVRGKPPRIPLQQDDAAAAGSGEGSNVEVEHGVGGITASSKPDLYSAGGNLTTVDEEQYEPSSSLSIFPDDEDGEATGDQAAVPRSTTTLESHIVVAESTSSLTVAEDGPVSPATDALAEEGPISMSSIPEDGHLPDLVVAGTAEASRKVLRSVDPHDLLKLLRWKRKKKSEASKTRLTKSYVKGKVIDGQHELYTLSIAVMIGVRTSILQTNMEINNGKNRRWVKAKDFQTTEKYEFRPKGGDAGVLTPPHQLSHTFKFKDYSPVVFAYLRRLSGVNEFDFLLSVCGNSSFVEFVSNAKSGQFFFYSSDGRFMIKTMTNAESKFLRRILPQYFRHCVENPNTMITRFLGMYRVKLYHLRRNVKFVIMNSVYYTDKYLQCFYDLKGSVVGRDAKPGQTVKKDNDLRRGLPEDALSLSPPVRSRVRKQLTDDCAFLQAMGVMDYSMLCGIHHVPHTDDPSIATTGFKGSRGASRNRGKSSGQHVDESHDDTMNDPDGSFSGGQGGENLSTSPDSIENRPAEAPSHRRSHSDNATAFFLEELDEDDSSYLVGSERRPNVASNVPRHVESERKKQVTVEKLYWPFHRMYDLHGHRRMEPIECPICMHKPCVCHAKEDAKLLQGYQIPDFVPPLSDRKDGGLEMDTSGRQLPMVFKGPKGTQHQLFGSKIFYMGVIDILQEYTSRKALEAQYRIMQTHGKPEASCVPPQEYSERFLNFFDEFTLPLSSKMNSLQEGVELSERGEVLADDDGNGLASTSN